jgi:ornithine carbamoyltransferase
VALRHFLQFNDLSAKELEYVYARTRWIKDKFKRYRRYWPLQDRTLAMIFEKQSTRTRLSFEAGIQQLGGIGIFLSTRDSQLGRGEPVEDAAQVISRMCDIVMIRTFEQDILNRFARHSRVPVINGLTNEYHPCQILADIYTYIEHRGSIAGKVVASATPGCRRRKCSTSMCTCRRRRATRSSPSVPASTVPTTTRSSRIRWMRSRAPTW